MWGWFSLFPLCVSWQQGVHTRTQFHTHEGETHAVETQFSLWLLSQLSCKMTPHLSTVLPYAKGHPYFWKQARCHCLALSHLLPGFGVSSSTLTLTQYWDSSKATTPQELFLECVESVSQKKRNPVGRPAELQVLSYRQNHSSVQKSWVLRWLEEKGRLLK